MNEKVKVFFDNLVIDEQEEQSDGKFGHYPFQGEFTSNDGKKAIMAFIGHMKTEAMLTVFAKYVVDGCDDLMISVDFPNCGDIMTDFVAVFSYIDKKIEVNLFPYDNKTGTRLGHVNSGVTYDGLCAMVGRFIGEGL